MNDKLETLQDRRFSALACLALAAACLTTSGCEVSESTTRHAIAPSTLSEENIAHLGLYAARCDDCHDERPDPAEPYCFSGVSAEDHLAIWKYEQAMHNADPNYDRAGQALFESNCGTCHDLPDPSQPGCFSVVSPEDVIPIHTFMENSRMGRELFEADCGSCHALFAPSSRGFESWSTHMCNADKHLSEAQEQQILLYLATHALKEQTEEQGTTPTTP